MRSLLCRIGFLLEETYNSENAAIEVGAATCSAIEVLNL